MNENIDLTKILKDCPKGTKLYSTIFGEVEFKKIEEESNYPIVCVAIAGNNCDVTADGRYYDVFSGECILFPSKEQRDWSKFTAPWLKKESDTIALLEKQGKKSDDKIEPKFKAGDWVTIKQSKFYQIKNITEKEYTLVGCDGSVIIRPIQDVDRLASAFTIQDAKDGDVLCCKSGWMCIFKAINNHTNTFSSYCFMDRYKWFCNRGSESHILDKEFIKSYNAEPYPATKEQRDLLFQKIKESGYEWNAKTKTLEELIKPKFDPKTLQPFDKVLVRDDSISTWKPDHFGYKANKTFCRCVGSYFIQCIPYNEETKHLVGTTDEAPEYYRYWEI